MSGLPDLETLITRVLLICGSLALWFTTQRILGGRRLEDGAIADHLHTLTTSWNEWLHRNPRHADALLVATSLCVDAVTLFVLAYAVIGPSFAPFWGLFALFVARQISQTVVALPLPQGIIWRDPGFPSLFVTYGVGNDLFFSGHTALAVYGAIQISTLQIPLLTAAAYAIAAFQALAVIVLRAHWTVDVIGGVLAAIIVGLLVR